MAAKAIASNRARGNSRPSTRVSRTGDFLDPGWGPREIGPEAADIGYLELAPEAACMAVCPALLLSPAQGVSLWPLSWERHAVQCHKESVQIETSVPSVSTRPVQKYSRGVHSTVDFHRRPQNKPASWNTFPGGGGRAGLPLPERAYACRRRARRLARRRSAPPDVGGFCSGFGRRCPRLEARSRDTERRVRWQATLDVASGSPMGVLRSVIAGVQLSPVLSPERGLQRLT